MSNHKQLILLFIILILSATPALANPNLNFENEEPDFRNINWGMNQEEVIESEEAELLAEEEQLLIYRTTAAGLPAYLLYSFNQERLTAAAYRFANTHHYLNRYLDDYSKLTELLTKKYGNPEDQQDIWHNEMFKNEVPSHGLAVSLGHLQFFSEWANRNTHITLSLKGGNHKVSLEIIYQGQEFRAESTEQSYLENL